MKPFFSVVIPAYNPGEKLGELLRSLQKSTYKDFETIVVDDGSKEKFKGPFGKIQGKQNSKLKIIKLHKNMGPAIARNRGVEAARGKFIVFLDSDVRVFPDTLSNLYTIYTDDPDIVAVTGVWVKEQASKAFFPNFKALRDWSYWINERDKSGYYFLFSTRIASIKKSVFVRLGGFDETYPAPLVEDIELTYRIARRYAIIFAPTVRVHHEFEGFWPIAKKYFLRAYYWTKLYQRRKKFDPVATTWQEALTTISGVGTISLGIIALFSLTNLPLILSVKTQVSALWYQLSLTNFRLFLVATILHILLVRKFLLFMYKEKGLAFAVKGFFTGLILYCFIFAGALAGRVRDLW